MPLMSTYLEDGTCHEACLQFKWEEILRMKDSCRLCLENYKTHTKFTSKTVIWRRYSSGRSLYEVPNRVSYLNAMDVGL